MSDTTEQKEALKKQSKEVLKLAKDGLDVAERQLKELIGISEDESEIEELGYDLTKVENGQKELDEALA